MNSVSFLTHTKRLIRKGAILAAIAVCLSFGASASGLSNPKHPDPKSAIARVTHCEDPVPGEYIVVIKVDRDGNGTAIRFPDGLHAVNGESVRKVADDLARQYNLRIKSVWDDILGGFCAIIPDGQLPYVLNDSRVDYVEANCQIVVKF